MSIPVLQGDFSTAKFRQYVLQMMQTITGSGTNASSQIDKIVSGLSSADSFGKYGFQIGLSTIDDGFGNITYKNQTLKTDGNGALLVATSGGTNYRALQTDIDGSLNVHLVTSDVTSYTVANDENGDPTPLSVSGGDLTVAVNNGVNLTTSNSYGYGSYFAKISTATNNLTLVKGSALNVGAITFQNTIAGGHRYLKFFNTSSTSNVTMGTTPAIFQIGVPPNQTVNLFPAVGLRFSSGLVIAMTAGSSLTDNTSTGAGDVTVSIAYA